jgi:hypothetical protein
MITIYEKVTSPLPALESILKFSLLYPCDIKQLLVETGQYKENLYINCSSYMKAREDYPLD